MKKSLQQLYLPQTNQQMLYTLIRFMSRKYSFGIGCESATFYVVVMVCRLKNNLNIFIIVVYIAYSPCIFCAIV